MTTKKNVKKAPKPLCVSYITVNPGKQVPALQRPYIIHWPARNKATTIKSGTTRKTFAVTFINDLIFIAAARLSKKDQFNRKIGIAVAKGRLDKLVMTFLNHEDIIEFTNNNPFSVVTSVGGLLVNIKLLPTCSIPDDVKNYINSIYQRFTAETFVQPVTTSADVD